MASTEIMRYFTADWRDGKLSDQEYDAAIAQYRAHVKRIEQLLPASLLRFISEVSIHDGVIQSARRHGANFSLIVCVGDLKRGYLEVALEYSGVSALSGSPSLHEVFENLDAEILEQEVDVINSEYEHRLLFAPEGALRVRFLEFDFAFKAVAHRTISRHLPVFRVE